MTDVATHQKVRRRYRQVPDQVPASKDTRLPFPDMSVAVKNFGPIARGKVDMRPLTVFAGPSNTGKSWFATLIYSLGMLPGNGNRRPVSLETLLAGDSDFLHKLLSRRGMNHFPEDPSTWSKAISRKSDVEFSQSEFHFLQSVAEVAEIDFVDEMLRCLGVSYAEGLVRINDGKHQTASVSACTGRVERKFTFGGRRKSASMKVNFLSKPSSLLPPESSMLLSFDDILAIKNMLSSPVATPLFQAFDNVNRTGAASYSCLAALCGRCQINNMHFLPADRGGIMHAHSAFVSALVRSSVKLGMGGKDVQPILTGVLSDFMESIVGLAERSNESQRRPKNYVQGLIDNVLRGTVEVIRSDVGYPRIIYRPTGWEQDLPLVNASSMVSEIGPLYLYLRHLVDVGDLIILEEPEAHLHPALQRSLIQEIAKWVKRGIRVLITTHSEWVIEELSNIVIRSESRDRYDWSEEQPVLSLDDVGVWRFTHIDPNSLQLGTKIKNVRWIEDEGGYEAGFYSDMVEQHNDWARGLRRARDV